MNDKGRDSRQRSEEKMFQRKERQEAQQAGVAESREEEDGNQMETNVDGSQAT